MMDISLYGGDSVEYFFLMLEIFSKCIMSTSEPLFKRKIACDENHLT